MLAEKDAAACSPEPGVLIEHASPISPRYEAAVVDILSAQGLGGQFWTTDFMRGVVKTDVTPLLHSRIFPKNPVAICA